MRKVSQFGRLGAILVMLVAVAEVIIMISPFAGFFYSTVQFGSLLGFLSQSQWTAWLDGFFLNHSVVTTSALLEWNRTIGGILFGLGMWGFIISATQVYGNKLLKRGVAKGLLYRFVRHPQYACLIVAGWGLLTIWPRFLLLGLWVTMVFLYIALSKYEEARMTERFGLHYSMFADTRGAFFPGSPGQKLFDATFGRIRPAALGWVAAYVVTLAAVFTAAFSVQGIVRTSSAHQFQPEHNTAVVSTWPQPEEWMAAVLDAARTHETVQHELGKNTGNLPIVATVLSPKYRMKGMFYTEKQLDTGLPLEPQTVTSMFRIAAFFLVPLPCMMPDDFMGVDPDATDEPVEVVFSRAAKPYKDDLPLEEALDPGVRLNPIVVARVVPSTGVVTEVTVPLPQNRWGPDVVMPIF